jgi:transcriptional regulator of arginine metabolism
MSKTARHQAILDLLAQGPVESQDLLQHRLEHKGFDVGQATLSRDIHELKLVKGPEGYQRADESLRAESVLPSVMHLVHEFVVEIRQAQNLLVVKTTVGSAQPVAAALDASHWPEVVGTLAGDDTVLVVAADKKKAHALARRIGELGVKS